MTISDLDNNTKRVFFSGFFLITFLFLTVSVSTVLFIFHINISWINLALSFLGTTFLCREKKEKYKVKLYWWIAILLIVFSILFCMSFYEMSYDSNSYHKLAIGYLKNGWNPLFENSNYSLKTYLPGITIKDQILAFPKVTWIFGACIYKIVGDIEAAKCYTLIMMIAVFLISYANGVQIGFSKRNSLICALFLSVNPVCLVQMLTFYNDAFLGLLLILFLEELIIISISNNKTDRMLLVFLGCMAMNVKFSGLIFCGLFGAMFYFYWIKKYYPIGKIGCDHIKKQTLMFVIMVLFSLFGIGATTYVANVARFGNPFYTVIGSGAWVNYNSGMPTAYKDLPKYKLFFASLFSKTLNVSESESIQLKIPFTFDWLEFNAAKAVDTRIAGWGIVFGGIFLVSTGILLTDIIKNRNKTILLLYICILCPVFFVPGLWWARYYNLLFFIPVLALTVVMKKKRLLENIVSIVLCVLLLINLLPGLSSIKTLAVKTKEANLQFEELELCSKNGEVTVATNKFHGRYFNMLDRGIVNYKIAANDYLVPEESSHVFPAYSIYYQSIIADMHKTDNIYDYLTILDKEDYTIIISVKDDASRNISNGLENCFRNLGLEFSMNGKFRYGYVAVISDGKVLYEQYHPDEVEYKFENELIYIKSAGANSSNESIINIENEEYSCNKRGYNIVVIGKDNSVIDSVVYDPYTDTFNRK